MTSPIRTKQTNLLSAGVAAGPIFIVVAVAHALARDGYSITKHPTSLLSNGDLGWIQIANFITVGILFAACGFGIGRALTSGPGRTWVGLLYIVFGAALIGAGIFVTDPALGFPRGTPEGVGDPATWSTSGTLHAFMPFTAFLAIAAAFLIMARRFATQKQCGWMAASIVVPIASLVLLFLPQTDPEATNLMGYLWAGMMLAWSYASMLAWKIKSDTQTATPHPTRSRDEPAVGRTVSAAAGASARSESL